MNTHKTLNQLGWQIFFQQQLTLEELEHTIIARVTQPHRTEYLLLSEQGSIHLMIHESMPKLTVGDWVLLHKNGQFIRVLERSTLLTRKASGSKVDEQLIAANVDVLFIVTSLNDDLNESRLERYLALAKQAGIFPVIVLTKADLCERVDDFRHRVQALDPLLMIEVVNALEEESCQSLASWCSNQKTVAFIGSSGVGKSTLMNTLMKESVQQSGAIREDDSKGRHVTTSRSLYCLPAGGVLIDTPGMRELQLVDCEIGIQETFSDIEALTQHCRFSDCQHQTEPGCHVQLAISQGQLEQRRLNNFLKLSVEQARNSETLAVKRERSKQLGKLYKTTQSHSRQNKKGY